MWRHVCRHFSAGDLHHGIERFERASRFFELADDGAAQLRVQAWLSYCYVIQGRPEKGKARATAALAAWERVGGDGRVDALAPMDVDMGGLADGAL